MRALRPASYSIRAALVLPVVTGVAVTLAGCQDAAASNSERETHMGDASAAADPWPALPPAPSTARPTSLAVAAPAIFFAGSAPAVPTPSGTAAGAGRVEVRAPSPPSAAPAAAPKPAIPIQPKPAAPIPPPKPAAPTPPKATP